MNNFHVIEDGSKIKDIIITINTLLNNFKKDDFRGYDPFDGLQSKLLSPLLFQLNNRYLRLFLIQFMKRFPYNIRHLLKIEKGYNSKGLALCIQGLCLLYKTKLEKEYLDLAYQLADIIQSQKNTDRSYFSVGYNFYWEARAFSVPKFKPNMIVSSFVAQAFLDLYQIDKHQKWLLLAEELASFMEKELKLIDDKDELCFGYIPQEKVIVHNANLMGARLYARLYEITKSQKYRDYAIRSTNYTIKHQNSDGSWVYGTKSHHQWVDNFHTGFNLVAIKDIQKSLQIDIWDKKLSRALEYHLSNHFLRDMTPKYYNNKLYPIDIHNFAQGIITLISFSQFEKAKNLFLRVQDCMWHKSHGYYYYQKQKFYTNKINYFRWGQAFMFYALTKLYFSYNLDEGK